MGLELADKIVAIHSCLDRASLPHAFAARSRWRGAPDG